MAANFKVTFKASESWRSHAENQQWSKRTLKGHWGKALNTGVFIMYINIEYTKRTFTNSEVFRYLFWRYTSAKLIKLILQGLERNYVLEREPTFSILFIFSKLWRRLKKLLLEFLAYILKTIG